MELRRVTMLDFRLGHVQLTEDQIAVIQEKAVPILAEVAQRLIRERQAAQRPVDLAAAGKQN